MKVRFGFVAIALDILEGSPNKTITVKTAEQIANEQDRLNRFRRILQGNLATTLRIMRYNIARHIEVYRFTSKTVPLATHPLTENWDYISEFRDQWQEIGSVIKKHNLRVSAHPDHYTLLNSTLPEVLEASIKDLDYHVSIFEAMELPVHPQLVIHTGGLYKDKKQSIERFLQAYNNLPPKIKLRIMLENDDKSYSAADVLGICKIAGCPMVLDIHHHFCNNSGEELNHMWPQIIQTWRGLIPKIHLSSPKNDKQIRSHADFINIRDFLPFLQMAKEFGHDLDVMVEAKQKDLAMFKLLDQLSTVQGITRIDHAAIEL
ncbi:UV DNA damage repair endonuclease UvsE [bacterium BFN5]|nr:UV DNA damage repair endonuclease UvsE [bacterium BFN5]